MAFLPFRKKKKIGSNSKISFSESPYLKKLTIPSLKPLKRKKKSPSLLIPPARFKNPHPRKRILLWCSIILAICSSFYLIFFSGFFNLKKWDIEENGIILTTTDPAYQILTTQKGKNILFLDEKKIIEQFKKLYPNIKTVRFKKSLPGIMHVELENYPIVANLVNVVGENVRLSACKPLSKGAAVIQKNFLIDNRGFLATENIENQDFPYIKVAGTRSFKVKTTVIPAEKLDYILKASKLFKETFNLKILSTVYKTREREVHLCTEKQFEVWIDMEKDLEEQILKLKKALPQLDLMNNPPVYIDLRIAVINNERVDFCPRDAQRPCYKNYFKN
jgi:hypothetical protein